MRPPRPLLDPLPGAALRAVGPGLVVASGRGAGACRPPLGSVHGGTSTQSSTWGYNSPGGIVVLAIAGGVCVVAYRIMLRIGKLPLDLENADGGAH